MKFKGICRKDFFLKKKSQRQPQLYKQNPILYKQSTILTFLTLAADTPDDILGLWLDKCDVNVATCFILWDSPSDAWKKADVSPAVV